MATQFSNDTVISEHSWEEAYYTEVRRPPTLATPFERGCLYFTVLSLPLLALVFGGTPGWYASGFAILTVLLLAHGLWHHGATISSAFKARSLGRMTVGCLAAFALYVVVQGLFSLIPQKDPVLGSTHRLSDLWAYLVAFQWLLVFSAVFVLSRVGLAVPIRTAAETRRNSLKRTEALLTFLGLGISAIALSHWFTDNGKLFWVFAPEFVEAGTRARWPFVNPNHLAAFLIPLFFVALSRFSVFFGSLIPLHAIRSRRRLPSLSTIVSDQMIQDRFIRAVFRATFAMTILMTIGATLSRAAWFACGLGLFTLSIIQLTRAWYAPAKDESISEVDQDTERSTALSYSKQKRSSGLNRRKRSPIPGEDKRFLLWLPFTIKLAVTAAAVGMFILFLSTSETAASRITDRIQFGLTHSLADIRWELLGASAKLFQSHPFFGVGLGGWREAINPYLPVGLAGLNPVYLHSDPAQLLVEVGLVGVLPFLFLGLVIGVRSFLAVKNLPRESILRLPLICIISGGVALVTVTFFDFPMRIPAVLAIAAFYLALLTAKLDNASGKL